MEQRIMDEIAKNVPLILTILAFGTFIATGIFITDYYTEILSARFAGSAFYFALFIALIHEITRFGLLISSIRDFSENRRLNAWLGFIGSIALVAYDIKTANQIAVLYGDRETFSGLITFLVLIGLLLEFRLILTVEKRLNAKKTIIQTHHNKQGVLFPDRIPDKYPEKFSTNGKMHN